MFARVSKFEGPVDKLDKLVELFEKELLPNFQAQPGFKGVTFLVDRENGRALGTTFGHPKQDSGLVRKWLINSGPKLRGRSPRKSNPRGRSTK